MLKKINTAQNIAKVEVPAHTSTGEALPQ